MQLTGADLKDEMAPDERWQALKNAMNGKNILLVLDDAWEANHITDFNFIDEGTSSRVLISSRVREVLEKSAIIDLKLPSAANAVQILLNAADHKCAMGHEPPEALEVVQFCNSLPLALGIAGRLLRSMALGVGESWAGVVAMLREEFQGEDGAARAMENSVIRSSLKSIKGKGKTQIIQLFSAFALIPEDTPCPLDILELMYVCIQDGAKPPNRFQIRKWLKVLINRSLVLGSVDRPQLHDIVLEFVLSNNTRASLQCAHRQLLVSFKEKRPADTVGFDVWDGAAVSRYICNESKFHIEMAVLMDWKNDELILMLVDELQGVEPDALQTAACDYLGYAKLLELSDAAAEAGHIWKQTVRLLGAFRNRVAVEGQGEGLKDILQSAISACQEVPEGAPESVSGLRSSLEYSLHAKWLICADFPKFQASAQVMNDLSVHNKHPNFDNYCQEILPFVEMFRTLLPSISLGNYPTLGRSFIRLIRTMTALVVSNPSRSSERRATQILGICAAEYVLDGLEYDGPTDQMSMLPTKVEMQHAFREYDHGTVHKLLTGAFSANYAVAGPTYAYNMLMRFLDAGEAEFMLVTMFQHLIDIIKQAIGGDVATIFVGLWLMPRYLILAERVDLLQVMMNSFGWSDFAALDKFVDLTITQFGGAVSARGDNEPGPAMLSSDQMAWKLKAILVLSGVGDSESMASEFVNVFPKELDPKTFKNMSNHIPDLPADEELVAELMDGRPVPKLSNMSLMMGFDNTELIGLALERGGDLDRALEYGTACSQPHVWDPATGVMTGNVTQLSGMLGNFLCVRILCKRNRRDEAERVLQAYSTRAMGGELSKFKQIMIAKQAILSGIPEARMKFNSRRLFAELKGPPAIISRLLAGANEDDVERQRDDETAVGHLLSGLQQNWQSHP
jgi:hypothetical protein